MARKIYQLKVTLKNIRPPIWRRFQVEDDLTFYQLHTVLQTVMGWYDAHLHSFDINGLQLTDAETLAMGWGDGKDDQKVRLSQYLRHEKQKFRYVYDFGDDWEHEVLLEKILTIEEGVFYPRCIKGKRECPPEDCGGVWGYQEILEILKDKNHSEYETYAEWIGEDFDSEHFDLVEINDMLQL